MANNHAVPGRLVMSSLERTQATMTARGVPRIEAFADPCRIVILAPSIVDHWVVDWRLDA